MTGTSGERVFVCPLCGSVRRGGRRRDLYAEGIELGARLGSFRCLRMTLDEQAQLANARVSLLSHLQERHALAQLCGGGLGAAGKAFEYRVEIPDRFSEFQLTVGDFAQVKLRLPGKIVERIGMDYIPKLAGGHFVAG